MDSILIHLTDGQNVESCQIDGLTLAARIGAKVQGVFAIPALASTFWGYEAAEYLPVLEQQLQNSAQKATDRFTQLAKAQSLPVECITIDNAYLSTFAEMSIGFDLLVTPQPKSPPDSVVEMEFQAPDLVVGCACPTIVIPRTKNVETIGTKIVIAWNNSRESSRAVRDALPLLKLAKTVVVLGVYVKGHEAPDFKSIDAYLTNHGITHSMTSEVTNELDVTETILNAANALDSDLIIMGAWGHSRIRELVLGGVTREILEKMTIPVLMSH